MSYDLHLFRAPADVDLLRAAEESLDSEERELAPRSRDPDEEERTQALAACGACAGG